MGQTLISDNTKLKPFVKKLTEMGRTPVYRKSKRLVECTGMSDATLAGLLAEIGSSDVNRVAILNKYGLKTDTIKFNQSDSYANNKGNALKQIAIISERMRNSVLYSKYTEAEVIGFTDKIYLAEKMIAGTISAQEEAVITLEAQKRGLGETALELAQLQVNKAFDLRTARSVIDGNVKKALDDIEASSNTNELEIICTTFATNTVNELEAL